MNVKQSKIILILLLTMIHHLVFSNSMDSIQVKGRFLIMKDAFVRGTLYQFKTDKIIKSFPIENGDFSFQLPLSIEPGVYRLQYEDGVNKPHTDIIIDGKEPVVSFGIRYIGDNSYPDFTASIENKKWYDYLKESNSRVARLSGLFDYLSYFSGQVTGKQILRIYQKERRNYYHFFSDFIKNSGTTWRGVLVKNRPYYFSDLYQKPVPRDFIRLNYYWEDIDTSNPSLVNTPIYCEHIETYLNTVLNDSEKKSNSYKEIELKKAIKVVIEKFSKMDITKRFAFEYLKKYCTNSARIGQDSKIVIQNELDSY